MAHETPTLKATKRQRLGTRYSRRLRRDGQLPAVVYGHEQDPAHLAVDAEQFLHHLHHGAHVLQVATEEDSQTCLIKDVQYDYLGTNIIHVDLTRIDLNEEITVTVPLELKGKDKSPGARTPNAIVEQPLVDLEINCLASNIPDKVIVDISAMQIDQALLVRDLKLPEGVTTDRGPDEIVVSIHVTRELEEPVVAEAAVAEPEVITERKEKPEEGAAEKK